MPIDPQAAIDLLKSFAPSPRMKMAHSVSRGLPLAQGSRLVPIETVRAAHRASSGRRRKQLATLAGASDKTLILAVISIPFPTAAGSTAASASSALTPYCAASPSSTTANHPSPFASSIGLMKKARALVAVSSDRPPSPARTRLIKIAAAPTPPEFASKMHSPLATSH